MSNEEIITNLTKKLELLEADKAEILDALDVVLSFVSAPNQTIIFKARKVVEKYSHD